METSSTIRKTSRLQHSFRLRCIVYFEATANYQGFYPYDCEARSCDRIGSWGSDWRRDSFRIPSSVLDGVAVFTVATGLTRQARASHHEHKAGVLTHSYDHRRLGRNAGLVAVGTDLPAETCLYCFGRDIELLLAANSFL
jgi:hypothetical protein